MLCHMKWSAKTDEEMSAWLTQCPSVCFSCMYQQRQHFSHVLQSALPLITLQPLSKTALCLSLPHSHPSFSVSPFSIFFFILEKHPTFFLKEHIPQAFHCWGYIYNFESRFNYQVLNVLVPLYIFEEIKYINTALQSNFIPERTRC